MRVHAACSSRRTSVSPRSARRGASLALALALSVLAAVGLGQVDDKEQAVWAVWQQVAGSTKAPAALDAACAAFRKQYPRDPLATVTRGIQAWAHLQRGAHAAAAQVLQSMLVEPRDDILQRAGVRMARTWLTRLDRELVRDALQDIYRRQVAYPDSLAALRALAQDPAPPLTDRWGDPWAYAPVGFAYLEGFPGQKYRLHSPRLGENSDLAAALAVPYGARIDVRPVAMLRTEPGNELVQLETTDAQAKRVLLSPRVDFESISLAYIGNAFLILTDGNHWFCTAIPR